MKMKMKPKKLIDRSVGLLGVIWSMALVLLLVPVVGNSKPTPKLLRMEAVEFTETSDEIFQYSIPYIYLAPIHQNMVKQYKPLLIKSMADSEHTSATNYHVKRAAMSEEAPKGTYLIYYETYYNNNVCEISAVNVTANGNYSIKTSLC